MRQNLICSSISRIFISSCLLLLVATEARPQVSEEEILALEHRKIPFFNGVAVSFDFVGAAQLAFGDYGQYEAALRVNLRNKYFPIVEIGYGKADSENVMTGMSYKTKAPYGRIGLDFNLVKNKRDVNRLYGGLRYGYTSYKFDVVGIGITDPEWGDPVDFRVSDVSANYHWMEIVFGVDVRLWGPVRLGWSGRYKRRLFHDDGTIGNTWYVPGYGKQGNARLGGTFNIILEL